MEPLATDEDAVYELLALVDEVYAPTTSASALSARVRRRLAAQSRRALRDEVEALQRTLHALRNRHHGGGEVDMSRVWASVALRQRRQVEGVAQENWQLKQAARQHREVARCVAAVLDELRSLERHVQPTMKAPGRSLSGCQAPPLFVRRLDAVCERVASREIEMVRDGAREHHTELDRVQNVLRFWFRSRAMYPFKLSAVADEMWRLIQEQTPAIQLSQDEIYDAESSVELRKPFGWLKVHGESALRRVFMNDGGVLLVSVATVAGTMSEESGNLMTGLSMHETIWVRMVRARADDPRSPVFLESVTESEVFASDGAEEKFRIDDSDQDGRTRLERFRDFIETYAANERGEGRQKLENRLLDASLSRGADGLS